jgi:hypothetical protein
VLSKIPNICVRELEILLHDDKIVCEEELSAVRYHPEVFDFPSFFLCLDFSQLTFSSRQLIMKKDGKKKSKKLSCNTRNLCFSTAADKHNWGKSGTKLL